MQTILITGGSGFIGSNFINLMLSGEFSDLNLRIINLDALTYAGNPENLQAVENKNNYVFIHGSIQNNELVKDRKSVV